MKRKVLFAAMSVLVAAAPLRAQMPEAYKETQLSAMRLQRRMLLAMADSMPENLYRDKVTPVQRDFAQQVEHIAGSMTFILNRVVGIQGGSRADTATVYNTRAGLKAYVNAAYDFAEGALRAQTGADRDREVNLFGTRMPAWKVWDELHQHAFWTAGQIVANFRKNGMAPPGFGFF